MIKAECAFSDVTSAFCNTDMLFRQFYAIILYGSVCAFVKFKYDFSYLKLNYLCYTRNYNILLII